MTPTRPVQAGETAIPADPAGPGDQSREQRNDVFEAMVSRLNRQSVDRHFDAYEDVDWDGPDSIVDPSDPRWQLWSDDPLTETDWYQCAPESVRTRVGLYRIAAAMRMGADFENILSRGLLAYAFRLPGGRPEFRYLQHEVAEEAQHTMMFYEFVSRSGAKVRGLPRPLKRLAELFVIPLNRSFPELFFLFVLGGEDPIDFVQRRRLRSGEGHPLVARIMKIHVTEEARHRSFARQYLTANVPQLGALRRRALAIVAPILLGIMARQMLLPDRQLMKACGVPEPVRRQAIRNPRTRTLLADSVASVRRLCGELDLMTPTGRRLWRVMGISG